MYNKRSKLLAYIRKHKVVKGVSKRTIEFYGEYKLAERK
jgi:hypothetical protein